MMFLLSYLKPDDFIAPCSGLFCNPPKKRDGSNPDLEGLFMLSSLAHDICKALIKKKN